MRRLLGVAIVPEANRVLYWFYHITSPFLFSYFRFQSIFEELLYHGRHQGRNLAVLIDGLDLSKIFPVAARQDSQLCMWQRARELQCMFCPHDFRIPVY